MLNIACVHCGKKYRIDETNMKGTRGKVKCKACGTLMVITIPRAATEPPEAAVNKQLSGNDEMQESPHYPSETVPPSAVDRQTVAAKDRPTEPEKKDNLAQPKRDLTTLINRKKARFGLSPKIIIVMLIVSLLPLAVFWGITFRETRDRVRIATENLLAQTARGIEIEIDGWINNNVSILRTAAKMPEMISMDGTRQEGILKVIQQEYPWMYRVSTLNPEGMTVARNDDGPLEDFSDRQYYKDILAGNKISWQTLVDKISKKPALVLALPIKKGDNLLGIVTAAVTIDEISNSIANWRKGQTGFAFLIDEKGFVLSHPEKENVTVRQNLNRHPLIAEFHKKGSQATTSMFNTLTGEKAIGHVSSNNYGWTLVLQQRSSEIFDFINQIEEFAFFLLAGTILLVLIIAWILARAIVRPIMKLTDAVELMSFGELNVTIDIKSKNEIGLLARAIGRLQTSL
ncbi:hypothetical protein D1AOALGA4SA_755 [Olavius algarvensis Delta 1 endosymbiont]|nr:hypothetical protein D1AOALGA4SA_755 [Olavius algarvensis Delta 1 endosymbiont]